MTNKRFKGLLVILCLALFRLNPVYASTDRYTFSSPLEQQRFYRLTQELRCLVCQNQSLADSNAPLAEDLRQQVANQIKSGATDQQVLNYLQQRYGDFIFYRPRLQHSTYLLWLGPWILLGLGLSCLLFKRKKFAPGDHRF